MAYKGFSDILWHIFLALIRTVVSQDMSEVENVPLSHTLQIVF